MAGLALFHNLFRKFFFVLFEKFEIFLCIAEVVRQHDWYLVNNRIVSAALHTKQSPVNYNFVFRAHFKKFQRIVFVNGTCKDV